MKTPDEIRAALVAKAREDDEFRKALMADPKTVVKQEFDIDVPDGIEIQVHEDSSNTAHLVLPNVSTLSEENLAQVAGGKAAGKPQMYWCL